MAKTVVRTVPTPLVPRAPQALGQVPPGPAITRLPRRRACRVPVPRAVLKLALAVPAPVARAPERPVRVPRVQQAPPVLVDPVLQVALRVPVVRAVRLPA